MQSKSVLFWANVLGKGSRGASCEHGPHPSLLCSSESFTHSDYGRLIATTSWRIEDTANSARNRAHVSFTFHDVKLSSG